MSESSETKKLRIEALSAGARASTRQITSLQSRVDTLTKELEEAKDLLKRVTDDVLITLAGSGIATPQEGYIKVPGWVRHDIKLLRDQRDASQQQVTTLQEALEHLRESAHGVMPSHTDHRRGLPDKILALQEPVWTRMLAILLGAETALASTPSIPASDTDLPHVAYENSEAALLAKVNASERLPCTLHRDWCDCKPPNESGETQGAVCPCVEVLNYQDGNKAMMIMCAPCIDSTFREKIGHSGDCTNCVDGRIPQEGNNS